MHPPERRFGPEDRLVLGSLALTLAGVGLAALLHQPAAFGVTALLALAVLLAGWAALRTPRLAWLLVYGLVVGTYGGCMLFIAAAATEFCEEGAPGRAVAGGTFAAAGITLSGVFFFWLAG